MRIAICQINPVIGDFVFNTSLIREFSEQAKTKGCSLAIFPEMSVVGYPPKDLLEKQAFISENLKQLKQLASKTKGIRILCGFVDRNPNKIGKPLINSVALIKDGLVINKGGKRLLPAYDVFDETRYFEPAQQSLVFEMEGKCFGVNICEDIWNVGNVEGVHKYPINPISELKRQNIDILINISASPYTLNKGTLRRNVVKKLAVQYQFPILFCNQIGSNDDLLFDGSSMVVDRKGRLVLTGKEFEPDLLIYDTERTDYNEIKNSVHVEEESILKGLTMGIRDYTLKCGFEKVLIGLSGGIDSSLVAVIAQRAMGSENVMGISMPSQYTSEISREDAERLAQNLRIRFREIPITEIFNCYKKWLSPVFKGREEDETEENIQARIRGNLLMALSNKFNYLLLSTGNKSEMAMGYCTLYGDMSGGLAVISDIPKTLCYRLAEYINKKDEIIPARVLSRPPTAELRPDQTDQDNLPPYEVLDQILEAAMEKNLGFKDIVKMGFAPDTVKDVLNRLAINEYKRRQAPLGLKITTKAFGYGRRYPITRSKRIY